MKILIAEDDESSRQSLELVLTSEGYEVVSFENGFHALSYLRNQSVDLIISDIAMPVMDGYGLCREVKKNDSLKKIPFIFYTATYTSAQDEHFALWLGAAKFLVKPILTINLLSAIAHTLNVADVKHHRHHDSQLDSDKLLAECERAKLDRKIDELIEERQRLLESEARFKAFAEASADWFWESDNQLNVIALAGCPENLNAYRLVDLAQACYSHSANVMLKALEKHAHFSDFIVQFGGTADKPTYLKMSGKPIFDVRGEFTAYRGAGRDVTEMVALNRRVDFLATHDELTGLPNRSLFKQQLDYAVTKAKCNKNQVILLFLDLDHFKSVNDVLGHEAGDQLLIMATKRITECMRDTDLLCRLGSDEFILLLEDASPQDGHRLARDIIERFSTPFEVRQKQVYCTMSVGVSVYPDDTEDPQSLLVFADLAMYRAKQNGRNNFEFYTSNLNFTAHQTLDIENGIRQAIKENQFFLVFQPQVEDHRQPLVGIECLLRWRHPERGLIPPTEFINVAEQSSLINLIDGWVIDAACKQVRAWLDAGFEVPRVSINISARHLHSKSFTKTLRTIATQYEIPPSMLCLEITEHTLLEDIEVVQKNMEFIATAGFSVSLDDFGTGHSSLTYLKRWAVSELKIDRSFIYNLLSCEEDRVIVKAIIALADALGLTVIAEGVENQAQADIVKASGCNVVQGFLHSAALSALEIQSWFKCSEAL